MTASKKMGFVKSIFFTVFPLLINQNVLLSLAKDVITRGDELNSTSTLVSAGGKFTLGFFTIPITKLTYLGIWYTDDDVQDSNVWVANRDIPMISNNGVLMIDESGTLKVVIKQRAGNNTNTTLFNVSNELVGSGINTTRAVLEDSGNFVLYDVANGNQTLWQSFDQPTDTLLPGMKLGYNLTTGQNWTLTSWLSNPDPASGAFTLRLDEIQNSPQLRIYWHGEIYWSSGPWESGTFQILRMESLFSSMKYQQKLSLISDATGMYFTYQTIASTVSMLVLSSNGYLFDGESRVILTPKFCYGYESKDGCAITDLPTATCRGQRNSFQQRRGYWSGSSFNYDNRSVISLIDCMEICWNDCNCLGFDTNSNGTGCRTWTGRHKSTFIHSDFTELIYVLVSNDLPKKKKKWIWILCVAIVLTSILTALVCYVRIRTSRRKAMEAMGRRGNI